MSDKEYTLGRYGFRPTRPCYNCGGLGFFPATKWLSVRVDCCYCGGTGRIFDLSKIQYETSTVVP